MEIIILNLLSVGSYVCGKRTWLFMWPAEYCGHTKDQSSIYSADKVPKDNIIRTVFFSLPFSFEREGKREEREASIGYLLCMPRLGILSVETRD